MMKKFIFTASASAVLLFSGCSLPFTPEETKEVPAPTVSVDQADTLSKENPEQLFFDFAKASGGQSIEKLNTAIPDKEILVKSEGKISVSGDFNLAGTPLGGGTGNFDLGVDIVADYSDENNPLLSEVIDLNVDAMGGIVSIKSNAELRIVEQSIFGIINTLDFNIMGVGPKEKEIVQKFVGKWYGDSFENIEELAKDDIQGLDLRKMFAGSGQMIQVVNLVEDIAKNPENHISFGKFIEEKDGYFFFEVTPKKETYEKMASIVKNIAPVIGTELDSLNKEMQKMIDEIALNPVIIGYTAENPQYFKSKTLSGNVSIENTKEGFQFIFINQTTDTDQQKLVFTCKDGTFSLSVTDGETITPLTGTYTDSTFTFNFNIPEKAYQSAVEIIGNFKKTGDAWSGEITTPQLAEGKIIVSDLVSTVNTFKAKFSAMYGENTVANIQMAIDTQKPESVSITKPENVTSFTDLGKEIEAEVESAYAAPEDTIVVESTPAPTSTPESTNTVPNPDTIPAVPAEVSNATLQGNVQASASSDLAELNPLFDEMAKIMLNENPTEELQAEFMNLKNQIDTIATEKGITEDELRTAFQNAVQRNSGQELTPVTEDIQ